MDGTGINNFIFNTSLKDKIIIMKILHNSLNYLSGNDQFRCYRPMFSHWKFYIEENISFFISTKKIQRRLLLHS